MTHNQPSHLDLRCLQKPILSHVAEKELIKAPITTAADNILFYFFLKENNSASHRKCKDLLSLKNKEKKKNRMLLAKIFDNTFRPPLSLLHGSIAIKHDVSSGKRQP